MQWSKLLSEKRVGEFHGKKRSEPDSRTPFERDYGRVVFSTPLRRLQDKTQVFPLEEHDSVRTRLTHSLEVSSVARTLGHQVGNWIVEKDKKGEIAREQVHDIETIAATCGLMHDLGNPPFGHAGETAIRTWFANRLKSEEIARTLGDPDALNGIFSELETAKNKERRIQFESDFLNWEGNAQTLRLISRLQVLADYNGLNLTCGTFSAACKYVARSSEVDKSKGHQHSKPGFFASEEETVTNIAHTTGTKGARNPITYLVEASDDIVYSTGDLEDAVRKGIIDWEAVKNCLRREAPDEDLLEKLIKDAEKKVKYKRRMNPAPSSEAAQAFRTFAIHEMKEAVYNIFRKRYNLIMNGEYDKELVKDPECKARALISACKNVGANHVYPYKSTLKLELMGRKVIHDLMSIFWDGAKVCGKPSSPAQCKSGFEGKAFGLISENYVKVFTHALAKGKLPERYCRLQLVTDQIAGMTDTFAIRLHKRLMNG